MKVVVRGIAKHFGIGLATVLPFAFAIWVVVFVVNQIDGLVGFYVPWTGVHIPGLGFVLVLCCITAIGLLSRIYISRVLFSWADALFTRIPVVKSLYTTAKELLQNVIGRRRAFQEPVLVEWPDERALVLGFITGEHLPNGMDPDGTRVSVYLPNAFQFAGATVIVLRDRVRPCGMTVEEALKFSLSAGLGQATGQVKSDSSPDLFHSPSGRDVQL
ncbi:DUF502 domain-containing protein [Alicyclobacillus dauci]|uniref:DUF502 domain-containing protein n=1 Tax=Alicyclobacillus dauci TaxID=1475485 RepID=A0ABY6Z9H8_9BACL|nr:DUF502 domain-containing protein [Alicyclobacillus dauci]WAH38916.1 DUF502 domain-containing protein [Alicyclobacillus dauci]